MDSVTLIGFPQASEKLTPYRFETRNGNYLSSGFCLSFREARIHIEKDAMIVMRLLKETEEESDKDRI